MFFFGIDPGKTSAYTIIADDGNGGYSWEAHGTFETSAELVALLPAGIVVGIEVAGGFAGAHASGLIVSQFSAGGAAWLCEGLGHDVTRLHPSTWRARLCGHCPKGEKWDKVIEKHLRETVSNMPKRCTVDSRDACGVAIVTARMFKARKVAA